RDKRIVFNINGQKVIDYTEPENPERPPNRAGRLLNPNGGAIALQAHDPDSVWYFKEIQIKRLPD
ncbi:MAG TPA: family 16 glycoside hydrolase, partial [Acidobacteriota bacterium]|nr:family 16 glycoside hydrolase [Acidobacteriota bacterium]